MLTLEKAAFRGYVTRFQREGEGRWLPSGTTAPSLNRPRDPVPSPLLSMSNHSPLPTRSFLRPGDSDTQVLLPSIPRAQTQPIPSPPSHPINRNLIILFCFCFVFSSF